MTSEAPPPERADDPGADVGPVRTILDSAEIARSLTRMAHQVVELNHGADDLIVLGIPTRGVPLSRRLAALVGQVEGVEVPVGTLDITMYRDDLRKNPTRKVGPTHVPGSIEGKNLVIVDDVLQSGRTVLAALDALKDIGRPARVMLAVLVDRGHRELPLQADVTGLAIGTAADERVSVHLSEADGTDEVTIQRVGGVR
ncbi:bifunctional pyr operon transcriptional regulator/uracil phosphoribosyltransferase PyrR [Luteococcus peritonei]|uniref:Bifunctional protein PyrR n=1 Tax=Luteococcus peritonei TaxID=88874 RepID=A0ABW4RVV8_9ACTN